MKQFFTLTLSLFCALSVAAPLTGPAVGTDAPDIKVRNLVTWEDMTLSSQRGKVVILTFWASWCGPCKRELPILEGAQRAIGKDRLVVLAVNWKDTPDAMAAIKKIASHWQINVMTDLGERASKLYSISSVPHLFMIGPDGKVIANHLGYGDRSPEELVADINHALATPVPDGQ
jgi:thiol-disulfide isomerase/thioredoxin